MKIQKIAQYNGANSQKKYIKPNFQGFVNGNYYRDEIIALAKKYRYNPHWKEELRKGKESIEHAIENWHHDVTWGDGGEYDKTNRTLLGIFSLGISEVLMNTTYGISAALKNKKIENMINEIAKCIDDLRHDS